MAALGLDAVRGILGVPAAVMPRASTGAVARGGAGGAVARGGLEAAGAGEAAQGAAGFKELFLQALRDANALQLEADRLSEQLLAGQVQDVSQVMVAAQKAELSLQLAIQMRNKLLEAYQEIMRMQV